MSPGRTAPPARPARPVVLTRQPSQAGAIETGLAAAGYQVAFLPLTDFEVPPDGARLRAAVRSLAPVAGGTGHDDPGDDKPPHGADMDGHRPDWVLLTSPNAVRALVRAGWDGCLAKGIRVAVTGPGTARVLAEAGCAAPPWMPDGDASAAGILARFPSPGESTRPGQAGRRVLLPQSALATDEVAGGLSRRGWDVDRVEAYRTVPYPADPARRLLAPVPGAGVVALGELSGADVVLTSPSAVRELVRRRGATSPSATRFIAIGRPTARAARTAGLDLAGTAATPDAEGLIAVLASGRTDGRPGPDGP
jgi:uroporphyrinogen-III synthase